MWALAHDAIAEVHHTGMRIIRCDSLGGREAAHSSRVWIDVMVQLLCEYFPVPPTHPTFELER